MTKLFMSRSESPVDARIYRYIFSFDFMRLLRCLFCRPPTLPTTQSAPHTSGFSSGDVGTYLKPSSPQGKPYGTDDMAPYLDSGVIPAFYHTGYTPVPNDNIPGASHIHSDPSKDSKNPGAGPTGESNLPFSSSNNTEDPNTLYSTVDKTKKTKEQTSGFQSSGNGNPDIRVEKPQKQKKKRKKSGNYFDSDDSISGEDIDTTNKMKEVASNMSLRGSIKPGSGGNIYTIDCELSFGDGFLCAVF